MTSSNPVRPYSTVPRTREAYPSSKDAPIQGSPIPILTSVKDYRQWRTHAMIDGKSVGFVATMGALHDGHLSLVQTCLEENDHTVVSIFVNPAQFAPTEDLASYPRTIESDIQRLCKLTSQSGDKKVSIAFVPLVSEMYPNGLTQIVADQVGAFVEVKGLSHMMEGGSRPTFFRGVATVVTKLFHVIQPDRAYFGQKDIQQAIIIRRLVQDLLFSHPPSAQHVRILPTGRDPNDHLALSSRNAYLTRSSRQVAPVLYRALAEGQRTWQDAKWSTLNAQENEQRVRETLYNARQVVLDEVKKCDQEQMVNLQLDYISLNHSKTLENFEDILKKKGASEIDVKQGAILSGAALISQGKEGKITRLIDNLLLGFEL